MGLVIFIDNSEQKPKAKESKTNEKWEDQNGEPEEIIIIEDSDEEERNENLSQITHHSQADPDFRLTDSDNFSLLTQNNSNQKPRVPSLFDQPDFGKGYHKA